LDTCDIYVKFTEYVCFSNSQRVLEEEWGPGDIGVRFGLTEKGRSYLKELEVAARIEPKRRESVFIRPKYRIFA